MTHLLPHHAELPPADQPLPPAYATDAGNQPLVEPPPQLPTPAATSGRKRKKQDAGKDDVPHTPAEPRRLRRSHEACARCRSKKIKCDSKHPRCSACETAGHDCHQEDRYRHQLTPRGHTELLEHQLGQCVALLRQFLGPGFTIGQLDEVMQKQGLAVVAPPTPYAFTTPPPGHSPMSAVSVAGPSGDAARDLAVFAPQPPVGVPPPVGFSMYPPPGSPFPLPGHSFYAMQPPPSLPGHLQPTYGFPLPMHQEIRGADPNKNDVSSEPQALANTFNMDPFNMGPAPPPAATDFEDFAIGSGGLESRRDRYLHEASAPRDKDKWISVVLRRNDLASLMNPPERAGAANVLSSPSIIIWLPVNRETVQRVVQAYFERLNIHRPVYSRSAFEQRLDALYEGRAGSHDPGFICSLYLILALGTMSEINRTAGAKGHDGKPQASESNSGKHALPANWPDHDAFFERALIIKEDLRVTVSSLQALILLHWYLYTERQNRTLWRLVGSLVRLAVELGLHHDPLTQFSTVVDGGHPANRPTFSEDESFTRIRLWDIVTLHDRGTSVLLGRPLAIHPSDSNAPGPIRSRSNHQPEFSEHYASSYPITLIQASIVTQLYTPHKLQPDQLVQRTTEILASLVEKRKALGDKYQVYFEGKQGWSVEKHVKLVEDIGIDQGLTLLKLGITRLLLMRALFRLENGVVDAIRDLALRDAAITAHNIIIIHNQLIRYPDAAFFVTPSPLHISAFVILFAQVNQCDVLPPDVQRSDVWMALDMLPRFRWRWDRKDMNGGHPYLHGLAEKILGVNLSQVGPLSHPGLLLEEPDWSHVDPFTVAQPATKSERGAPVPLAMQYLDSAIGMYPFYLENASRSGGGPPADVSGGWQQHPALAVYQQSQASYMQEERDVAPSVHGAPTWMQQSRGNA